MAVNDNLRKAYDALKNQRYAQSFETRDIKSLVCRMIDIAGLKVVIKEATADSIAEMLLERQRSGCKEKIWDVIAKMIIVDFRHFVSMTNRLSIPDDEIGRKMEVVASAPATIWVFDTEVTGKITEKYARKTMFEYRFNIVTPSDPFGRLFVIYLAFEIDTEFNSPMWSCRVFDSGDNGHGSSTGVPVEIRPRFTLDNAVEIIEDRVKEDMVKEIKVKCE